jgi:hypothetical protein
VKCAAKSGGLAESKGIGNVLDSHHRIAKIFDRDVHSQFIKQLAV